MTLKKPSWIKTPLPGKGSFAKVKKIIAREHLATVCAEAACPNLAECWGNGTMTIMILGENCTRACKFCNVTSKKPLPPDPDEPLKVANTLDELKIKFAVITSVTRDDLPDYGAEQWAKTIRAVRNKNIGVEVLTPDFMGKFDLVKMVCDENPEIFSHNLETVRRLSPEIRSVADYDRSLNVLSIAKELGMRVKSSLMLGMGETDEEIVETMKDLKNTGVSILAMGQYLQPSTKHLEVKRYVTPEQFDILKETALKMGFEGVESAPFVRSSYHAEKYA